jgi:hypothetical protein
MPTAPWSIRALSIFLLISLVFIAAGLAISLFFGMVAFEHQDRWMLGMPCATIALFAMAAALRWVKIVWLTVAEMWKAVRSLHS